jgi:hypothetical protein
MKNYLDKCSTNNISQILFYKRDMLTYAYFAGRQTFLVVIKLSCVVLSTECLGFILYN